MGKNKYNYRGAVNHFNICISPNFIAQTMAVSAKQAEQNIKFQFKKRNGLAPDFKIELIGKLEKV